MNKCKVDNGFLECLEVLVYAGRYNVKVLELMAIYLNFGKISLHASWLLLVCCLP